MKKIDFKRLFTISFMTIWFVFLLNKAMIYWNLGYFLYQENKEDRVLNEKFKDFPDECHYKLNTWFISWCDDWDSVHEGFYFSRSDEECYSTKISCSPLPFKTKELCENTCSSWKK